MTKYGIRKSNKVKTRVRKKKHIIGKVLGGALVKVTKADKKEGK